MKELRYILIIFLAVIMFSCEEDDITPQVNTAVAPVLSGAVQEGEQFVFLKENKTQEWATLSWSAADFGPVLAVNYTVEIDRLDNNFADAFTFSARSNTSLTLKIDEINKKMYDAEYLVLTETDMEIRVKAVVSDLVTPLYSEAVGVVLTIFDAGLPKLYVPGSHQHTDGDKQWNPGTAPVIYSANEDEHYEGYIYFTSATDEFKFTSQPNWDGVIYGGSNGNLDSQDNIVSGAGGMHFVKADVLALTYSLNTRIFGVLGASTPTGWDSDTNMEYDYDLKKLKLTLDLTASGDLSETGFKFRANDAWDLNFGDDNADGIVNEGGANIAVPESGNYTIYLDLSTPDYKYELVKN